MYDWKDVICMGERVRGKWKNWINKIKWREKRKNLSVSDCQCFFWLIFFFCTKMLCNHQLEMKNCISKEHVNRTHFYSHKMKIIIIKSWMLWQGNKNQKFFSFFRRKPKYLTMYESHDAHYYIMKCKLDKIIVQSREVRVSMWVPASSDVYSHSCIDQYGQTTSSNETFSNFEPFNHQPI